MMHDCPSCGLTHGQADELAEPELAAPVVEPGANENDVRIAEVEAAAAVQLAKVDAGAADEELREEVARLRGELAGVRETLDAAAPPAPEVGAPIVVPPPAPVAEPAAPPPPPAEETKAPRETKRKTGIFGF
jgi:hypothetical protein